MNLKYIIHLGKQATISKDNINKGAVGFAGYGFVFRDISYIAEAINLNYTSRICHLGTTREFLKLWEAKKGIEYDNILNSKYDPVQDLYYVGAIKTLVPSLNFGRDELLFEVGILVTTPEGEIFPATFYWGVDGLSIGGWKQEPLKDFIMLQEVGQIIKFKPIKFTVDASEKLTEAIQSALQKVPTTDFEGVYWGDLGKFRMGIKSNSPFITQIPVDEDIEYALIHYDGEFKRIMVNATTSEDQEFLHDKLKSLATNANPDKAREVLIEADKILIYRCYDKLVDYAKEQYSRYAYQALAIFLMEHKVKMTDDVRKLVLNNSLWQDEFHKLKERKEKIKRRKFLIDFRAKVLVYKE